MINDCKNILIKKTPEIITVAHTPIGIDTSYWEAVRRLEYIDVDKRDRLSTMLVDSPQNSDMEVLAITIINELYRKRDI